MKKVFITGGIGTGKSTVAKIIEHLGYKVYNADDKAKSIVVDNQKVKDEILVLLGQEAYFNDGSYNRKYVAELIYKNKDLLVDLNRIIHPAVAKDFESWLKGNENEQLIFKEAALVTELSKKEIDFTIVVKAPFEVRIRRIKLRDKHRSESDISKIIENQISEEDYLKLANFVVLNDEQQLLIPQIIDIINQIKKAV